MSVSLCWFRSDLRVADNTALWNASQYGQVIGIYYATPGQWRMHDMADCKASLLMRSVQQLREDLKARGIPLLYRSVDGFDDIPDDLTAVAEELDCEAVFWNREYPVNEKQRDAAVKKSLHKAGVAFREFDDFYVLAPGSVTTADGSSYKVFTPFSKAWKQQVAEGPVDVLPVPEKQSYPDHLTLGVIPEMPKGFGKKTHEELWPAGEPSAKQRLENYVEEVIRDYAELRDIPSEAATSQLSPYLAIGAISARQCLEAALRVNQGELFSGSKGVLTWINELIWRDFYGHVLAAYPRVSRHRAFRPDTETISWRDSDADLHAWCEGKTGVPIVDAAMRQLAGTGWMHNRLRMVAAMYLSKNLLLDWRLGERHFMRSLIDGDLAQNNGGWQWSASTGTDSVPYFRIFNPFSQAQRFDPEGKFIHQWVPELAELPAKELHDPDKLAKNKPDSYPDQRVNLSESRARAIDVFKRLKHSD